ncbi:MAG TPA: hypothetical protein VN381_12060 [Anaerovoracaceae bacterium]|nr:hypothetical protein [Anaerovoracaceae bacterium]
MLKSNIHINILIDRLSGIRPDFTLVLDDLHLISDPDILGGLSYLIDYLPEKMHLILIGRTEPGLNMPKQRIKWQARQLEGDDLLFNNEEIFRFYQARGFTLESDELERIENYSEGWAAALVAVAMSMERGKEGYDAVAALAWSSRDIGQYLRDEVVRSWRPEKLAFAIRPAYWKR